MKLNKKLGFIFLIFAITFTPVSFSSIFVLSQASEVENITGYQEWNQSRIIDKNVVIEPDATLVIGKGVEITFINRWIGIRVEGNLFVKGTVKEPAIIKGIDLGDGSFAIETQEGSNTNIRNTEIINGGSQAYLIGKTNTAMAASYKGAIQVNGGDVDVQNTTFKNNLLAVVVSASDADVRVNRSRFIDNGFDVESKYDSDFRYNWWGFSDGPKKNCYDYRGRHYCYYDKIYGDFDFSSWLTQENFLDPVIIIPGILGSFDFWGEKKLDPFLHTYDYLYETFKLNGYTPEQELFAFPYEWRDSNIVNAQKLKIKIDEIKSANNWPKVDIVAHSMGGLLAREYIESNYYGNDVDQLITLGTPQRGAPKDYLTWEGGEIGIKITDILDNLAEKVFTLEAHEKDYSSIFDYIRNRPILSIQELLPTYNYLYDNGSERIYPANYPTNSFLETLNNSAGIYALNNIEFDNIIGNLDGSDSTISRIDVVESDDELLWKHGYPEDFDSIFGDHGLVYGDGDGTVPLESASLPSADEKIEINAKHGALPEEAANISFELLTKHFPQNISISKRIKNIISFFVFSPIDIQVVAPDRKRVGKDFETGEILLEIPDAYYTGYDTDSEFLTIPDPEDGEYIIITQGTGNGDYKIEVTKLAEDPDDPQKVTESTGTIEGIATTGTKEEKNITIKDNEIITGAADTTAPEIVLTSPQSQDYLNSLVLAINYTASDNVSSPENIQKEVLLDGVAVSLLQVDLSLQKPGEHTLKIIATDEAGNQCGKELKFTVITNADAISQNITHYRKLGLITSQKTADFLQVKIKDISHTLDMIAKLGEKNNTNPPENKTKLLGRQADDLIKFIEGKFAGTIREPAGDLLIESLNYIKK